MDETKEDSLWIYCPVCGGKTRTKVCKETVLVKFPLYCPKCKKEIKIDVVQLKIVASEPDEKRRGCFPLRSSLLNGELFYIWGTGSSVPSGNWT